MGKLFVVPTPIGNLEDITLRAIRVLKEAEVIFAEDTRTTRRLLKHLDIDKQVLAFHMHNEHRVLKQSVDRIKSSSSIALVSDAGTPGISDPGYLLIRACIQEKVEVDCLPGAVAMIPAVVASGFPCDRFVFEGFLPHKKGRQTKLKLIAEEKRTTILYESPHRLVKCLGQIVEFMGEDKNVCVAREITKMYEEHKRGTAAEIKEYYENHPPKGEIVIVIEGLDSKK